MDSLRDNIKVYMTWTVPNGHAQNLACHGLYVYQCPSVSDEISPSVGSGELFIGIDFTAINIALKNDTKIEKDLRGDIGPLMIQLQHGTDHTSGDPLLWPNSFPLFPDVQIRATLAVTRLQSMTNGKAAALGLQKVGRYAQNISSTADYLSSFKRRSFSI